MSIKGRETITVKRRQNVGGLDPYGNPQASVIDITLEGCLVAWGGAQDSTDAFGEVSETTATILVPYRTPLQNSDTFVLPNGKHYLQAGDPITWTPQRGSRIKPKTLVSVILKEGRDG